MNYEICQVPNYKVNYETSKKSIKPIDSIISLLNTDLQLHERLGKNDNLKLSIDIDKLMQNPVATLEKVINDICDYVQVSIEEISYTTNFSIETGSYHIVIPKYYMKSSDQKVFWKNFREKYKYGKEIDADVFGKEGWLRLPNQTKERIIGTEHIIQQGKLEDFVLKYIEKSTLFNFAKTKPISKPKELKKKKNIELIIDETTDEDFAEGTNEELSDCSSLLSEPQENKIKLDEIESLLELIGEKRCSTGKHREWNDIAQAIKNHCKDDGLKYFVNWTNKFGSVNKKRECIDQYTKNCKYRPLKEQNRLSIKSLYFWAKQDNPNEYNKIFVKENNTSYSEEELEILNYFQDEVLFCKAEYQIAKSIFQIFGKYHKCITKKNKIMYSFDSNKKIWERNEDARILRNLISEDYAKKIKEFQNYFVDEQSKYQPNELEHEEIGRKIKAIAELYISLNQTNKKNNICCEYFDIGYDGEFENLVNNTNNILSLKNGLIFNIEDCSIREKTIEDLFTYECDTTFIPYNSTDEKFIFVEKYFNDLFCNNQDTMQCVLDILKSSFIGKPLRYLFFCYGEGRNGKSVLFQVLQKIFKNAMDTISKLVIIKQKGNFTSAINTELQKLVRCRLAYVSELSNEDELNVTRIKEITGGDPIDYRGLQKDNVTIIPTCNLFNLTNKLPTFKVQKAICDRIINIPFKNEFEKDSKFEEKIMEHKDYLFSYIMEKGVVRDNFVESAEMLESKREYIEANNHDYLKDFITDTFEMVEYDNTEKTKIKRDDFRDEYNIWCKKKYYPLNTENDATFSKNMKKVYNIDNKQIGKAKKLYYIGLQRLIEDEDDC